VENPSQSYEASPAIWDLTMLPAILHRDLTPAEQAGGTQFTYAGGMEG